MEWSDAKTYKLIQLYEENEFLWNVKNSEYRNRNKKNLKFSELGGIFGCDSQEIQRKIHNLRNQVSHEIQKLKKKSARSDEVYRSTWKFFNALKFIIPVFTSSATESNLIKIHGNATIKREIIQIEESNKLQENGKKIKKKRKQDDEDDDILREAIEIMKKPKDDFDRFGEYVALELKSIKSDFYRGKLKSEIRKIVARIADEDERNYWSSISTSSSPMPSPTESSGSLQPSTVSTPMPSPDDSSCDFSYP